MDAELEDELRDLGNKVAFLNNIEMSGHFNTNIFTIGNLALTYSDKPVKDYIIYEFQNNTNLTKQEHELLIAILSNSVALFLQLNNLLTSMENEEGLEEEVAKAVKLSNSILH